MAGIFHAFAHLFNRIVVNWIRFLGTSPFGIVAQIFSLLVAEAKGVTGKWWQVEAWREVWSSEGLKRGLKGLLLAWAFAFIVCTITTVYDDHSDLVATIHSLRSANGHLEHDNTTLLANRDSLVTRVRELEQRLKVKPTVVIRNAPAATLGLTDEVELQRREAERKKHLEIRTTLGNLLYEAQSIKTMCLTDPPPQGFSCLNSGNAWAVKTMRYISQNLESSYEPRFVAATGLTLSYNGAKQPEINNVVNYLTFKSTILEQFIKEFKD